MLSQTFSQPTGIVVRRGSSSAANAYRVRISLEFRPYHGEPYSISPHFRSCKGGRINISALDDLIFIYFG
ncbi:hypothetical protein [Pantoea sp.]|uniref:hypothetical protein n=1 Tax=Pantoea sp. TaxID=69393 RepID=UPI0039184335